MDDFWTVRGKALIETFPTHEEAAKLAKDWAKDTGKRTTLSRATEEEIEDLRAREEREAEIAAEEAMERYYEDAAERSALAQAYWGI